MTKETKEYCGNVGKKQLFNPSVVHIRMMTRFVWAGDEERYAKNN
jgi:hypothetical protein